MVKMVWSDITNLTPIFFSCRPLKHYDFNVIQKTLNSDFSEAIDMTVHVFVFELIYRAIVCAFEVCCILND